MNRREFLRNMAAMPLLTRSCLTTASMLAGMKSAYAANGKTLVVVFQRGGCDGLNTVVPYADDEYYNLRPDIAIAAPGSGSNSALYLDGYFGLHPAMTGLHNIFWQGDLAVLPAVHYANANKSHFSSQNFIESGVPNQSLSDGWLNRYLFSSNETSELQAISFGTLAHAMRGKQSVVTVNSLSAFDSNFDSSQTQVLRNLIKQDQNHPNPNRALISQHGTLALDSQVSLDEFSKLNYSPENGADYPDTVYGQQLKDIAQLIKAGAGLELATVSNEGWDHHANQGGAVGLQATKLAEFSSGKEALYKDLGSTHMNDVTILTVSEFGRTAKQNASKGTDHGNATSWFVIGKQVNGGVFGHWPGLMPEQLYQGRYLAHTIDFTDVYAELLVKHLGGIGSLSSALPGTNYQPIGFL